MQNLKTQITSAVSTAVLFAAAVTMTGLGLAFLAALAGFAVLAFGVALLTAPFVGLADDRSHDVDAADIAA